MQDIFDSEFENVRRIFPSYCLDSPLLRNRADEFVTASRVNNRLSRDAEAVMGYQGKRALKRYRRWLKTSPQLDNYSLITLETEDRFTHFYRPVMEASHISGLKQFEEIMAEVNRVINSVSEHIRGLGQAGLGKLEEGSDEFKRERATFYMLSQFLNRVRKSFVRGHMHPVVFSFNGVILMGDADVVVAMKPDELTGVVMTWDEFLMFHDMSLARSQAYYAIGTIYGEKSQTLLRDMLAWQELVVRELGDEGYELVKAPEALVKTWSSVLAGDNLMHVSSYSNMQDKYREKSKGLGKPGICEAIFSLVETIRNQGLLHELGGLIKLSGFPKVSPVVGGKSSQQHGKREDESDFTSCFMLRYRICEMILRGYLEEKRSLPPLIFSKEVTTGKIHSRLYRWYKSGSLFLVRGAYPIEEWEYCKFGKFIDFDFYPNYLELMDDKAISYPRDRIGETWGKKSDNEAESTRLLTSLLARPDFDPKEIVARVINRDIPLSWYVVCLYPKEREFKLAPRMFCMLVTEMRFFFSLGEHNLKEVMRYLPQQTMTESKSQTTKRFINMTRPTPANSRKFRIYDEVDLTRWNLQWRILAVNLVGDILNDIYGIDVYTQGHPFFYNSQILVRVPSMPPPGIEKTPLPESDLAWTEHMGGFEGILQKQWTICTIAFIENAIADLNAESILTGQGDNQVLCLSFDNTQYPTLEAKRDLVDLVQERVEKEARSVNQIVKPEECIVSSKVVTYSKNIWVNGVQQTPVVKFLSRCAPVSNSNFPSLTEELSSYSSSFLAAAEHAEDPLRVWTFSLLFCSEYLLRCVNSGSLHGRGDLNPREAVMRVLIPNVIGGIGIDPIASYHCRGSSDPLSAALLSMSYYNLPEMKYYTGYLESGRMMKQAPDVANLISDPFSIPIDKPSPPSMTGTPYVRDTVKSITRNKHIRSLISDADSGFSESLNSALASTSPMYPLIFHDLYKASPAGIYEEFSRKFSSASTIQKLSRATGGYDFGGNILRSDLKTLVWSREHYLEAQKLRLSVRPTTIFKRAETLRKQWHLPEPPLGVTTLVPGEYQLKEFEEGDCGVVLWFPTREQDLACRGPITPYVGSRTPEKRADAGVKVVTRDPASKAAKRLAIIRSQIVGNKHWEDMIKKLIEVRVGLSYDRVSAMMPHVFGGIGAHRNDGMETSQNFSLMGKYTVASHCLISTDKCGEVSTGELDFPVSLQEWICAATQMVTRLMLAGDKRRMFCLQMRPQDSGPIYARPVITTLPVSQPKDLGGNPLVYSSTLTYEITNATLPERLSKKTSEAEVLTPRERIAASVISDMLGPQKWRTASASVLSGEITNSPWDIASVLGAGTSNVISGTVDAICLLVIGDFFQNYHKATYKTQSSLIRKSADLAAGLWIELLMHKDIQALPTTRAENLHPPPGFGSLDRLRGRVIGGLIEKAQRRILSLDYWEALRICFPSTDEKYKARTALWFGRCRLAQMEILGNIGTERQKEMANQGRRMRRGYVDQRSLEELPAVEEIALDIEEDIRVHGDRFYTLENYKNHIIEIGTSAIELRRTLRSLPRSVSDVPVDAKPVDKPVRINLRRTRGGALRAGVREIDLGFMQTREVVTMKIFRNASQITDPRESISYRFDRIFAGIRKHRHFSGWLKRVLVVGVGQGGIARSALEQGATVIGHDLNSLIPPVPHRFLSWVPPDVSASGRSSAYSTSRETMTTTGDWFDLSVAESVLNSTRPSLVIIDIEEADHLRGLELLNPSIAAGYGDVPHLIKLVLNSVLTDQITCDLQASGYSVQTFCTREVGDISQVYFLLNHQDRHPLLTLSNGYTGSFRPIKIQPPILDDEDLLAIRHGLISQITQPISTWSDDPAEAVQDIKSQIRLIQTDRKKIISRKKIGAMTESVVLLEILCKHIGLGLDIYAGFASHCAVVEEIDFVGFFGEYHVHMSRRFQTRLEREVSKLLALEEMLYQRKQARSPDLGPIFTGSWADDED